MDAALYLALAIVLVGLVLLGGLVVLVYNRLVRGRILVQEGFSGIDVQLKRRHDLIPNLVSTVRGYAAHEQDVLEQVTQLRTQAMGDVTVEEKQQDENRLSGALKSLLAVAENYPDLKANTNYLDLQRQLSEVEDDLQKARRYYNGTVRDYNTLRESFPSNLVSGMFAFPEAVFFELDTIDETTVPNVDLEPGRKE